LPRKCEQPASSSCAVKAGELYIKLHTKIEQCTTEGCAQPVDCLGAWQEYGACVHETYNDGAEAGAIDLLSKEMCYKIAPLLILALLL